MTAKPVFSTVENLRTAGAAGTVPTSDGSNALVMSTPSGHTSWAEEEFTPTAAQISFILSALPSDADSVELMINGVDYVEGVGKDYIRSGATITWLNNFILTTTDNMVVRYQ